MKRLARVNELIVSGINLRADQTLTVTYMTDIQATADDVTFNVAFDGSHGPGEGFADGALPDETVTVMDARAGSGDVA